jgi:hypothetical protein
MTCEDSRRSPTHEALTVRERVLLDALVAFVGDAELTAQATGADVVAECACGCGSVVCKPSGLRCPQRPFAALATIQIADGFRSQLSVATARA